MRHHEYLFLLEEAHYLWEQALAAEADGDEFVPSESFIPLDKLEAKARIIRPGPGKEPMLVLLIRGCAPALADSTAKVFFSEAFDKAGISRDGEHIYVSSVIPPRLRP
jgi:hypothetical protein